MDTQTTVGNGMKEQASTADGETSRHDQRGQVSRFGGRRRLMHYRKRGGASYIVREIQSVRERERRK